MSQDILVCILVIFEMLIEILMCHLVLFITICGLLARNNVVRIRGTAGDGVGGYVYLRSERPLGLVLFFNSVLAIPT